MLTARKIFDGCKLMSLDVAFGPKPTIKIIFFFTLVLTTMLDESSASHILGNMPILWAVVTTAFCIRVDFSQQR